MFKKFAAYIVGKTAVKLHYKRWLDIYALCSVHEPERYKKSQSKAKIPASIRWAVWRRDGFICIYCLGYGDQLSLDHIVPEVHGGEATLNNLVTACSSCNNKKADKSFDDFLDLKWLSQKREKNHQHLSTMKATVPQKSLESIRILSSTTIGNGKP